MGRHHDWSPLNLSSDPVPGEPDEVWSAATRLQKTATAIQDAHDDIKNAASETRGLADDSEAIEAFQDVAEGVADKLIKALPRYEAAADALRTYYWELVEAQKLSLDALHAAEDADLARTTELAAEDPPGPFEETAATKAMTAALDKLHQAIQQRDDAAEAAAKKIENTIEHDDVKDSIWDNLSGLADVLSTISAVLGVLALVVNVIPVIGQALSAALGAAALILGAIALVIHLGAAIDNGEGWDKVLFDAIGVATFGVGRAAMAGARTAGLASRTMAWSKLSRMGGSTASRLASGGFVFSSKGPMGVNVAGGVLRNGALGGKPFRAAYGGLIADLRGGWAAIRTPGALGYAGQGLRNLATLPGLAVRNPAGLSHLLQGDAALTQLLDDVARVGEFSTPAVANAIKLAEQASTFSTWSHVSFVTGSAGTLADNVFHLDVPVLP
jgi:hypothetical protein